MSPWTAEKQRIFCEAAGIDIEPEPELCATFFGEGSEETFCGRAGTIRVKAGCVHEHVTEGWVCEGHIEDFANGDLECGRCASGPGAHVCEIVGRPVGTHD